MMKNQLFYRLRGTSWAFLPGDKGAINFIKKRIVGKSLIERCLFFSLAFAEKTRGHLPLFLICPISVTLPVGFDPQVYMVGKNRYKAFDLRNGKVLNFPRGRNDYCKNEVKIRTLFSALAHISPNLLDVDTNGNWYIEELIPNVHSGKFSYRLLVRLLKILRDYLPETGTVRLSEYVGKLSKTLYCSIEKYTLQGTIREYTFEKLQAIDYDVPIGWCHGDCCAKNIFVTSGKLYGVALGDWEYARECSRGYDLFTYASVEALKRKNFKLLDILLSEDPGIFQDLLTAKTLHERKQAFKLAILERMAFDCVQMPLRGYTVKEMNNDLQQWTDLLSQTGMEL